jgi:hypothetical protein
MVVDSEHQEEGYEGILYYAVTVQVLQGYLKVKERKPAVVIHQV